MKLNFFSMANMQGSIALCLILAALVSNKSFGQGFTDVIKTGNGVLNWADIDNSQATEDFIWILDQSSWTNGSNTEKMRLSASQLALRTSLRMYDNDVYFRGTNDYNHGLGWYGGSKLFAGVNVNGPVLYGNSGGILATVVSGSSYSPVLSWRDNGRVGIGTTTPALKLDVRGDGSKIGLANSAAWDHMYLFHDGSTSYFRAGGAETGLAFQVNGGGSTASYDGQTYTEAMRLLGNGNVGIGTTNPDKAKLQVKGSFHVENSVGNQVFHVSAGKQLVFVGDSAYIQYNATLANPASPIQTNKFSLWVSKGIVSEDFAIASANDWDDYVFNEDYQLPTLDYVAAFVKTNKHLPNIPSEAEVKKNGYSLIQLNRNFLKTIEELTLYAIDQENELKTLKEKTNQQALQIKDLQAKAAQYDHLAAEIELLKSLVNNLKK